MPLPSEAAEAAAQEAGVLESNEEASDSVPGGFSRPAAMRHPRFGGLAWTCVRQQFSSLHRSVQILNAPLGLYRRSELAGGLCHGLKSAGVVHPGMASKVLVAEFCVLCSCHRVCGGGCGLWTFPSQGTVDWATEEGVPIHSTFCMVQALWRVSRTLNHSWDFCIVFGSSLS